MLIKHAFLQLQPVPLGKTGAREKKIIPVDNQRYRYLRFRAIGNLEMKAPYGGFNGNWDGFLYEDFIDDEEGYGYRSFINKRAHYEHNSALKDRGKIGDLPDAYLNKFKYDGINFPKEAKVSSIRNNTDPRWLSILEPRFANVRESILNLPNQRDGAIEVLMRIDTHLLKDANLEPKTRRGLERLIKRIDAGQKISCSMGCFLPGTQITLPDGTFKYIENIRIGDEVISHIGVKRKVTNNLVRSYEGNILKINIFGLQNPLKITPEHPILIRKRKGLCLCGCGTRVKKSGQLWVSTHVQRVFNSNPNIKRDKIQDELKKQELIKKSFNDLEWEEARNLEKGDYIAYPISHKEIKVSHITEGKARLIGYFLAEGSYIKNTNKEGETYKTGVAFSFGNTEKDKKFIDETMVLLKQEFNKEPHVYTTDPDKIDKKEYKERTGITLNVGMSEVRLSSREAAMFFDYYCKEYAWSKELPEEVMTWPKNLQRHLIATYFNGDGSQSAPKAYKNQFTISLPTTSEKLAYQTSYILKRLGIPNSLERRWRKDNKRPTYTIWIRGHWQNILSDFWSYKEVKFGKEKSANKSNSLFRISDDYILLPVQSIEYEFYKGPVFNFEVEEDHSYIANGASVHNCNVEYSTCSVCGNKARFASDYCDHLKRGRKGSLSIVTANQIRDLLDDNILRPEWLKHIVASQFDVDEILKGSSNKGIAVRNGEINHKLSFFELSHVEIPAYVRADALEKIARKVDGEYEEYLKEVRASLGDDVLVDIYSLLQKDGIISSGCEVKW